MNLRKQFESLKVMCKPVVLGVVTFQALVFTFAQSSQVDRESKLTRAQESNIEISTKVEHIGTAEAKSISGRVFYPALQPDIYWHDADWNIDLLPFSPPDKEYSLSVHSGSWKARIVKLDDDIAQIDSISRAPNDQAIFVGDLNGMSKVFGIVDLMLGEVIQQIIIYNPSISPNRRFILYENWYPPHSESPQKNQYTLYDALKTPDENTCSHWDANPKHKGRDDEGINVFPHQVYCTDDNDDDYGHMATNFSWAADSSETVFADVKDGVMSLVLVTMPVGRADLPKTSVYTLKGAQDVCAGATDAAGDKYCDYRVIQSLGWAGDSVKASFHHQFGTSLDLQLTIPVSSFVPIWK